VPEIQERIILGDPSVPKYRSETHVARYRYTADLIESGVTVLDMGCGTGYGTEHLQNARTVVGVDIAHEAAAYARERYGNAKTSFIVSNAERCGLSNDSFDTIVCMEAIEHFEDIDAFLGEMERVLRPSGLFLVSTPNKLLHSPHTDHPENPYHTIEFELGQFTELLERHFSVEKMLGQQPQDTARSAAQRLSPPSWLKRMLLSVPLVQSYFAQSANVFVEDNLESCRFFYAICRNAKS
jgi:SAM-dependent methyltransferase